MASTKRPNRKAMRDKSVVKEDVKQKPRKKKKVEPSAGRELVVAAVGPVAEKRMRMTKRKIKELSGLTGEFKADLPDILSMLDDTSSGDEVQKRFLTASLAAIVDIIPHKEAQTKKTLREQDVYAFNALISQGREILNELRALSQSDEVAHRIAVSIIQPAFMAISSSYISQMFALRNELEEIIGDGKKARIMREAFQNAAREFGSYLEVSRDSIINRVTEEIE